MSKKKTLEQNGNTLPPKEQPQEAQKPVMTFGPYPVDGKTTVKVAVWGNQITVESKEITVFSCTIQRSYRDEAGWHENKSFRGNDIPVLIQALGKAYDWILEQRNNRIPF